MPKSKLRKNHRKAKNIRYIAKMTYKKQVRNIAEGFYKFLAEKQQQISSQQQNPDSQLIKDQLLESGIDVTLDSLNKSPLINNDKREI